MKTRPSTASLALLALAALSFVGCGTTTTVRLSGPPGTQVSGHYRTTQGSMDFNGNADWQMDFVHQRLEEFEFQKSSVEPPVALEILRGRRVLVRATAPTGTSGLRVRHEDGWKVENVR